MKIIFVVVALVVLVGGSMCYRSVKSGLFLAPKSGVALAGSAVGASARVVSVSRAVVVRERLISSAGRAVVDGREIVIPMVTEAGSYSVGHLSAYGRVVSVDGSLAQCVEDSGQVTRVVGI